MLDAFEILSTSGVVLWSKTWAPVNAAVVNSLINEALIEQRTPQAAISDGLQPPYKRDKYTIKWATAKNVGLVFVAVYQSILNLSWVDNLVEVVRAIFLKQYAPRLESARRKLDADYAEFDTTFDALLHKLDKTVVQVPQDADASPTASDPDELPGLKKPSLLQPSKPSTTNPTTIAPKGNPLLRPTSADSSRPSSPSNNHLLSAKSGPGGRGGSRRSRKALNAGPASSGDESSSSQKRPSAKSKRTWGGDGYVADEHDPDTVLDYSTTSVDADGEGDAASAVDVPDVQSDQMGSRTAKGQFLVRDLDDQVDAILAESKANKSTRTVSGGQDDATTTGGAGGLVGAIGGYFRNMVAGKTLTRQDLVRPLKVMEDHLLRKNVAREAAVRLCEAVEQDLIGHKTSTFATIDATIKAAMSKALTRILTPTSSLDLLHAVHSATSPLASSTAPRPYVISIVGVNGVGKSTNLSKLAYFFLQNDLRVLVCAADTFRSGAVEQLRVHVRNLSELSRRQGRGRVELFEQGYGRDAATVARDAVSFASSPPPPPRPGDATAHGDGRIGFDVVLVDTAGRRHNDERLMSSLTKFGQLAAPDKILMVGEALVGSDAVAQARNFAAHFQRGLDGFIVSKCDTVGDMVGTLVSMVHATGVPVVFLGVGQHYGDLRGLNVAWAVDRLMA